MNSKEAFKRINRSHRIAMAMLCDGKKDDETEKAIEIIKQDLERFEEYVKVIRILRKRKYSEWIKGKFYSGVSCDEEQEKLFKRVFGSSWRKY